MLLGYLILDRIRDAVPLKYDTVAVYNVYTNELAGQWLILLIPAFILI